MKEDTSSIVNTLIRERTEVTDTGPLFHILFLEGCGRLIYVGALSGWAIFLLSLVYECITYSHTQERESVEELPIGK